MHSAIRPTLWFTLMTALALGLALCSCRSAPKPLAATPLAAAPSPVWQTRQRLSRGDLAGALRSAATIPDTGDRERFLAEIAVRQARRGALDDARRTLASLQNAANRADVLVAVAARQAQNGDLAGAWETAWLLPPSKRDEALEAIAPAQARRGDTDAALQTLRRIADIDSLCHAQIGIADVWYKQGRRPEGDRMLRLAMVSARKAGARFAEAGAGPTYEEGRDWTRIAAIQGRLGEHRQALRSLDKAEQCACGATASLDRELLDATATAREALGDRAGAAHARQWSKAAEARL